jgi:hypothetical protein
MCKRFVILYGERRFPMIYSASRRTDMVAFRPDEIVAKVGRSRKLEAIVFWTKDVRNLVFHKGLRRILFRWPSVVQFTVTGLAGTAWEPNVPEPAAQEGALKALAALLPRGAVRWRFDPIMPYADWPARFNRARRFLEDSLGPLEEVTVSFPDPYKKAVARSNEVGLAWPEATFGQKKAILARLAEEFRAGRGGSLSSPVRLCCEPELLGIPGTAQARCVDGALFDRLYGTRFGDLGKDSGQRAACGCVQSTDIGSYEMACPHACRYCYANPVR